MHDWKESIISQIEATDINHLINMMKMIVIPKDELMKEDPKEYVGSMYAMAKVGALVVANKSNIIPILRNSGEYSEDTIMENAMLSKSSDKQEN